MEVDKDRINIEYGYVENLENKKGKDFVEMVIDYIKNRNENKTTTLNRTI